MILDSDALVYLSWAGTGLTFDPAGSTPSVKIDGVSYPMSWVGAPTQTAATARTTSLFAGTAVSSAGAVQLTAGRHVAKPIVRTADGQEVPSSEETPIDVE